MDAGSKSARNRPLEGLARLISAMTGGERLRSAPTKSRTAPPDLASSLISCSERRAFAAATSARFAATMRSRMVTLLRGLQLLGEGDELLELVLGRAALDHLHRALHARLVRLREAG